MKHTDRYLKLEMPKTEHHYVATDISVCVFFVNYKKSDF